VKHLAEIIDRHHRVAFAALLGMLLALAWHNRFIQDDAFIVFRYAENWVRGAGPVFNPGERVEGYTCFLYLVLIAAGMRAGLDPVAASQIIGMLACAGTLVGSYVLACILARSRVAGLVAMLVLGTNYTFSAYATGGLETQLHACLVTAGLALGASEVLRDRPRPGTLALASTIGGLAILTRPDSVLLLLPMGVALAVRSSVADGNGRARVARLSGLLIPAALLVGSWAAWKVRYYGDLLPNTFYLKALASASLTRGLFHLYSFVTSYWLVAGAVLGIWMWRDVLPAGDRATRVLVVTLALWMAYVVAIGGDFMEFRMFVAVLPVVAWLVVRIAWALELRARLGSALIALVLAGSLQHAVVYNRLAHPDENESVRALEAHVLGGSENWVGVGRALGRDLGRDSSVWIATGAAGAIPYYSGLRTVDMFGLTDPWVARHGIPYSEVAGHRRAADLDYLVRRGVTLVIAHPTTGRPSEGPLCMRDFPLPGWDAQEPGRPVLPAGVRAVEIPVDSTLRMVAYYLAPHARVEEAVRSRGWRMREVADCVER